MITKYENDFYVDGNIKEDFEIRVLIKMKNQDVIDNYGEGAVANVYKEIGQYFKLDDKTGLILNKENSKDIFSQETFGSFEDYFFKLKSNIKEEDIDFSKLGDGIFIELINGIIIHAMGDNGEIETYNKDWM